MISAHHQAVNDNSIASDTQESNRGGVFGFDLDKDVHKNARSRAVTYKMKPPLKGMEFLHDQSSQDTDRDANLPIDPQNIELEDPKASGAN